MQNFEKYKHYDKFDKPEYYLIKRSKVIKLIENHKTFARNLYKVIFTQELMEKLKYKAKIKIKANH